MPYLMLLSFFLLFSFSAISSELPLSEYTKAIEQSSPEKRHKFYMYRARFYFKKNQLDKSLSDFTESLKLHPTFSAYRERGEVYLKMERYQAAIDDLSMALKANPNNIQSYQLRSSAYYASQSYKKALKDANKVLAFHPNDRICKPIQRESEKVLTQPEKITLQPSSKIRPRLVRRTTKRIAKKKKTANKTKTTVKKRVIRKA